MARESYDIQEPIATIRILGDRTISKALNGRFLREKKKKKIYMKSSQTARALPKAKVGSQGFLRPLRCVSCSG